MGLAHELSKHPFEVAIGIGSVGAHLLDKGVDDRTAPAGVLASYEHPVLMAELGRADRHSGQVSLLSPFGSGLSFVHFVDLSLQVSRKIEQKPYAERASRIGNRDFGGVGWSDWNQQSEFWE